MVKEITLIVQPQDEHNTDLLKRKAAEKLFSEDIRVSPEEITLIFIKKSIDARHGTVKVCLRYRAYIGETPEEAEAKNNAIPEWKTISGNKSVIIIGCGPAGLFGALRLLENGIKPIIIERGAKTSQRKRDIASISTQNKVGTDSNYCFGEGGAGTFSDGKLYTRSNKRGDIAKILKIFAHFGADKKILTDAHPHIGTDRLPAIVNNMCSKIIEMGGEIHFNTRCVDFILDKTKEESSQIKGIIAKDTITGEELKIESDAVVLATGHSATDIYELIAKIAPTALEAKTFAVGVRVEHPRTLIDAIQYHGQHTSGILPTAEYRLVTQIDGRGVYSFCMCPGGFVVPSSTGPDEIVVNGMSSAARNSKWSNAAIVVETRPEDIPEEFKKKAEEENCPPLAGLFYRHYLEKLTKEHGIGQAAPAQRMTDFLNHRDSSDLPTTSYTPGVTPSRLDKWLPKFIAERLEKAFYVFNKNMKGYKCSDALMIAIETRTSTPVRILRDKETFECKIIKNLYPCGEGSGYSGGIVSSAMDGENACTKICSKLQND